MVVMRGLLDAGGPAWLERVSLQCLYLVVRSLCLLSLPRLHLSVFRMGCVAVPGTGLQASDGLEAPVGYGWGTCIKWAQSAEGSERLAAWPTYWPGCKEAMPWMAVRVRAGRLQMLDCSLVSPRCSP